MKYFVYAKIGKIPVSSKSFTRKFERWIEFC